MCAKAAEHQAFIKSDFPCVYMTAYSETIYWGSVTVIHYDHPLSQGVPKPKRVSCQMDWGGSCVIKVY